MAARRRSLLARLGIVLSVVLSLTAALVLYVPLASQANPVAASASQRADLSGYAWINYFRALGGLSPVTRDATIEAQESLHVHYLADHALGCETNVHDELIGRSAGCGANRYATVAGRAAARNSNITRVNAPVSDRIAVQTWFTAAFHALVLLEPRLRSTGYASYYTARPTGAAPSAYQFTAAVDVYRGRTGSYRGQLLAFPATGATSPLLSYQIGSESPEPFRSTVAGSPCHSWGNQTMVSAPVIVQWPVTSKAPQGSASLIDLTTGTALATCALTAGQYPAGSLAQQFLLGTNRVTKAALYYAAAPFVAGHRYQLRVAGSTITTFSTSNVANP